MKDCRLYSIVAIVNDGFSDLVMEVARDCGARGGTIISANGSASPDAQTLYGISVQPQKEIIMILVEKGLTKHILESLYTKAGAGTAAMGVFFSLPVAHASENLMKQYNETDEE